MIQKNESHYIKYLITVSRKKNWLVYNMKISQKLDFKEICYNLDLWHATGHCTPLTFTFMALWVKYEPDLAKDHAGREYFAHLLCYLNICSKNLVQGHCIIYPWHSVEAAWKHAPNMWCPLEVFLLAIYQRCINIQAGKWFANQI